MGSILRTCKPTEDISAQGNSHEYRVHSYESHGKNIMYILNKVTNYQMILKFRKTGTVWKIKRMVKQFYHSMRFSSMRQPAHHTILFCTFILKGDDL